MKGITTKKVIAELAKHVESVGGVRYLEKIRNSILLGCIAMRTC
jgi:hypothetical protein